MGSNCMGTGKDADHIVSFYGCNGASLEVVLPSTNHHPVILLGGVLLCHHHLLLCWVSSEPVHSPQVSGLLF